jgi:hypothetical protein
MDGNSRTSPRAWTGVWRIKAPTAVHQGLNRSNPFWLMIVDSPINQKRSRPTFSAHLWSQDEGINQCRGNKFKIFIIQGFSLLQTVVQNKISSLSSLYRKKNELLGPLRLF